MELEKFKKNNPVCYFPEVKLNMFAERCEQITGKEVEDLKNFTEFVESAVETALGSVKHVTSKLTEAEKSKADLQSEITELKKQNSDLQTENETATAEIRTLRTENGDLTSVNESLRIDFATVQKAASETKQNLSPNQIVIELTEIQKAYIDEVAETERAAKACIVEHNEFIPKIDDPRNTKAGNLMLAWTFYGATSHEYTFEGLKFRNWLKNYKK